VRRSYCITVLCCATYWSTHSCTVIRSKRTYKMYEPVYLCCRIYVSLFKALFQGLKKAFGSKNKAPALNKTPLSILSYFTYVTVLSEHEFINPLFLCLLYHCTVALSYGSNIQRYSFYCYLLNETKILGYLPKRD
jgi:hypothetical protein